MNRHVLRTGALVVAVTFLAGCAIVQPQPGPVAVEPPIEAGSEPPVVPVEPPSSGKVPAPAPLPPVAIVLSNNQPAYADVARELTRHFEDFEIYDLSDAGRPPVSVLRLINDDEPGAVVAIGLRAAISSVAMSEHPVVFSQVFNYRHHGLLQENSRGVAVLPPVDAQLAAWKELDPDVSRIGVIVGEGHEDLLAEAEIAAERHGIELLVQVTRSDQETLYYFRRMIRGIDGFWLLPDNRVLSGRVLQQMLADARRQRVPVSVPSDSLMSLGALASLTADASDVAATIAGVLRSIQAGKLGRVPPITPLSEIRIRTNTAEQVVRR